MEMSSPRLACAACHREIDTAARLCPYCGADPRTGEKLDTDEVLQREFKKPRQLTPSENVLEYARQRQGVVVAFAIAGVVLALVGLHQYATHRNETAVSNSNAVPLAEVTDIGPQQDAQPLTPMPELQFKYDGRPQAMRTFVVEPGAVTPPEVVAAQQAAAQVAAQQAAAKTAAAQRRAPTPQLPVKPQPHR
jgi:hypothetical protein